MTAPSRARLIRIVTGALVLLTLLLVACSESLPQDTLSPVGPEAKEEASLFWIVFWIAAVVFFFVEGLLVIAMIRFRHRPGRGVPTQVHGNRRLEILWTLAPALLLAGIAVPTVGSIFSLAARPPGDVLDITVTGHQWWWEVEYERERVITANEIHIPVGRPVDVEITSVDVIHSFWVPLLAGKQDLEPGRTNRLTLNAPKVGTYVGQCAEFCGASHANMRLRVIADTPAGFQRWVDEQRAKPAAPSAAAAEGADLFANGRFSGLLANGEPAPVQPCTACHSTDPAVGGTIGPNLAHLMSRSTFAGAMFELNERNLRLWLQDSPAMKPGSDMPNFDISDEQIDALIAYLRTLE
ncbi:MAG: cytochrome c oxidase subunit II [Actinomycetota bacterium]